MIRFMNLFVKITGYLPQKLVFRTKFYYEDREATRFPKGPVIIISNHTAVYDYMAMIFAFPLRTLRCQMAEVLFQKKGPLPWLLRALGGIFVNRDTHGMGFIDRSEAILRRGGAVLIFPESRIPLPDEARPLPFVPSAALTALDAEVPVIPVFTNGRYFTADRARIMIGKPINPADAVKEGMDRQQKIHAVNEMFRNTVIRLGELLDEKTGKH